MSIGGIGDGWLFGRPSFFDYSDIPKSYKSRRGFPFVIEYAAFVDFNRKYVDIILIYNGKGILLFDFRYDIRIFYKAIYREHETPHFMSSKRIYEIPAIQCFEVCAERGFAASPGLTIPDGGDDGFEEIDPE